MTVQSKIRTGASSHYPAEWHSIDWARCYREVRGLQARIVKATREGKTGKVKSLQWVLTHSFSGKALAVRRVTENKGRRTPGVDDITWSTPEAKFQAILSLTRRGYRPQPLRRLLIPKRNGKLRPLGIPTMRDRAMQALYLFALEPVAETTADRRSFGFRPKRSTTDAIEQCFTVLSKKDSAQWILEGDIKGCFDNISHNWLLEHITVDRTILRKWLKAGYMENRQLFPTDSGTPQGELFRQHWQILLSMGWRLSYRQLSEFDGSEGKTSVLKLTMCGMPMTSSSPGLQKKSWIRRSGRWSRRLCKTGDLPFHRKRPGSRTLTKDSIFWVRIFENTMVSF